MDASASGPALPTPGLSWQKRTWRQEAGEV